jgi:aminomethyltransferase
MNSGEQWQTHSPKEKAAFLCGENSQVPNRGGNMAFGRVCFSVWRIEMNEPALKRTPLYDAHAALGAKLVPFAGYEMPVQYPMGVLAEHNWTRQHAGLFDVSHMGQCFVMSPDFATSAAAIEKLVPADILGLHPKQQRYSQLLNETGGTLDDLMITRADYKGYEGWLYVVVNAGCKAQDYLHIAKYLPNGVSFKVGADMALLALQGPMAEEVLAKYAPAVRELKFMFFESLNIGGIDVHVSRSGYSGEDGFELSVWNKDVEKLWALLLAEEPVRPIGLGARDSLRLEAGLCLYGHELDETISPIEAGLAWSIAKRRREEGGFMGAARVQQELHDGVSRKRVGIKPDGRAPARDGTEVLDLSGRKIGIITSGGFGPTVGGPVAMGFVESAFAAVDTKIQLLVRGQALSATIVKLPFVPNNFKR